jgi:catechol-2,3-dioxygenase
MVHPTQIAHVVYGTHRFEEMLEFYTTVFGDVVRMNNGKHAFLSFDHEHHRHALINLGPATDDSDTTGTADYRTRTGVRHVAYTWADVPTLMGVYERLRDAGIKPVKHVKHGPSLSLYYEDPDGHRTEFYADVMSTEEGIEFMASDVFVEDPIGDNFDPEEILALVKAGEDYTAHVQRIPDPS